MICPKCKTESFDAKWCPECGFHLESEKIEGINIEKDTKGDTQKLKPVTTKDEEEISPLSPYTPREAERKYTPSYTPSQTREKAKSETSFSDKGFNYWIIAIGVVSVLVVTFILFRFIGIIPTSEPPEPPEPSAPAEEIVLEKEDKNTILQAGLDQLKLSNYDEAETIFKAVLETDPQNIEAGTLYQIVYNYNRALKKIQSAKYDEAREFYGKIPSSYTNYSIRTDVENLNDKIVAFETAYGDFAKVQEYMKNENYEDALNIIKGINKKYLSSADAVILDEYFAEIEAFIEKQNSEDEDKSETEDAETNPNKLSWTECELIITKYCENLALAINNKDFSLVENLIAGQLYNDQIIMVQNCIDNFQTRNFDMLEIVNINEISDTKWKVLVAEGETTCYSDGTQHSQTTNCTYTIELINNNYYLTAVEQ